MGSVKSLIKIVVTGPESTGKTVLSELLAKQFNAAWIPEYARYYIEKLKRPYSIEDLERIARHQMQEELSISHSTDKAFIVMDTWLIVTKVWFEVVYDFSPMWIENYIASADIDLFLVCRPDLPWIADPVRENGGEMRQKLFERYCREIEDHGFAYEIVEGSGSLRLQNALNLVQKHQLG